MIPIGLAVGVAAAALLAGWAGAYPQYSTSRTAGNCADCHGDFGAGNYLSQADGAAWNTSLHDGHRNTMLNRDCDVCHQASGRFPVLLGDSRGGAGFDPISCLGCHGRVEPGAGGAVTGSGLRQHHFRNGVTVCATSGCHADADPASFTTAKESVFPPYYFTPDAAHPSKPANPCNIGGSESLVAGPLGLDNDGSDAYDSDDPNCDPTPVRRITWGTIKQLYR